MSLSPKGGIPSWDSTGQTAPERPEIAKNLPEDNLISRPRTVLTAHIFIIIAVLSIGAFLIIALNHLDEIRLTLVTALPDDVFEEYDQTDIDKSTNIMLAILGAFMVLLLLIQLLSSRAVAIRRKAGGRVILIIGAALYLLTSVLALAVRDGNNLDLFLVVNGAALILMALLLFHTPRAGHWLKQNETPRYIPLQPSDSEPES